MKPAPVTEGFVSVPGAELYYRSVGSSAPLVVLHGGPDFNHNYFLPELDRLATSARLIYYDQRGRGKSSHGVEPEDVTIESEVDDLDRLRRHFGLESVSLLGHSWGCVLALEYATRHPDRTGLVVLMNPAPASHRDLQLFREHRQATEAENLSRMDAIARTRPFLDGDIQTEAEYYRVHYKRAVYRAEQVDQVVARLRVHFTPEDIVKARAIEERLYDQTWRQAEYDLAEQLEGSAKSVLVLHGEYDFVPLVCARRIAEASTMAKMVVVEKCGHFAYLENPEVVSETIGEFLKSSKHHSKD
jgi:proline iminopeptidase